MAGWLALILAVTLGVALLYRGSDATIGGLEPGEYIGIALVIGLCSVYLLSIFGSYRGRGRQAFRDEARAARNACSRSWLANGFCRIGTSRSGCGIEAMP